MGAAEEPKKANYLTPEEVAAELRISLTSVYRRIKDGTSPPRQLVRLHLVLRPTLVELGMLE